MKRFIYSDPSSDPYSILQVIVASDDSSSDAIIITMYISTYVTKTTFWISIFELNLISFSKSSKYTASAVLNAIIFKSLNTENAKTFAAFYASTSIFSRFLISISYINLPDFILISTKLILSNITNNLSPELSKSTIVCYLLHPSACAISITVSSFHLFTASELESWSIVISAAT